MKSTVQPQDRYYFVDATHPTHNPVLGSQWAVRGQRPPVLTNTARERVNVLGAYSPQGYVGFATTDNINAQALLGLIEAVQQHQPEGQIILICDNARYTHARCVREYLATSARVIILYRPAYSPNLNLIERLWGLLKDRVLRDYYATFSAFRQAIRNFFAQWSDYADDLRSLMTENFQIFNSV